MSKRLVRLAGAVGLVCTVGLWVVVRRKPPVLPPRPEEFSALRGSVERAASQVLPGSGVTQQKVELTVPRAQIDRETSRVKGLAADFGGSAVASPADGGGADLLVQLPAERGAAFLEAVKDARKPGEMMPAPATVDKIFVEVVLRDLPASPL
jgi:hypothetical protein